MLKGLIPPFTPSGKSALVAMPPWHYAGEIISMQFHLNREAAQMLLPENLGAATGVAYGHFCDWQSTTDGSELVDPVYAQYKEFFVLIEVAAKQGQAQKILYCPFIWVDQDIAMVRGFLQGWPKKMGQVWMTRSHSIDHPAAAFRQNGCQIGASLAAKDRRLAQAHLTLTGAPGQKLGFLDLPTLGLVGSPSIISEPSTGPLRLVRAVAERAVAGVLYEARGTLTFFESPKDELSLLQPTGDVRASIGEFALTVTGAQAYEGTS